MDPKVSIIMAAYNSRGTLKESLESILNQSFNDFEYIVIDDASTDGTSEILSEYAARDSRIKIVTNEKNIGLTKSLNKGIFLSKGIYIARMDADDKAYANRLSMQANFLDTHGEYGIVGSWATVIDDEGKVVDQFEWEVEDKEIRKNLIKYNCIVHPSVMIRRSVLDTVGGYDESLRYAQDYDLFFRIIQHSKGHNIPEKLLYYRVSPKSITGSKNRAQAWCAMRARWNAIRRGMYPFWTLVFLLRPLIGMVIPLGLKRALKKASL